MKHKRLLSILLALVLVLSVLPALPVFAADYNLTVAGVQVTDANKSDILGNGSVSYNSGTKTLTIKGDLSYSSGILIENQIDGLTITTDGTAKRSLTAYSGDVIDSNGAALTIKDANLSMISYASNSDRSAIYMHNGSKTLTFENAEVYMNGGWTLCGQEGALTVKESYLTIAAGERAVSGFGSISLSGCALTKPAGGKYTTGTIYESDGSTIAKNVTIARTYALKIAGVQVTDANKHDVLGDGAFEFDTDSYSIPVLYIKKDCNAGTNNLIDSELDYLTITVNDRDVTLTVASGSGKVGIKSTGTVLLGSDNNRKLTIDAPTGIYIKANTNCNLLIGTMSVDVKNSVYGITGTAGKVSLSFYQAEVSVQANSEAVSDFRSIGFDGCQLLEPAGGTWDTGTIMTSTGAKATTVKVGNPPAAETYNISICGKTVTSENQDDVLGDGAVSFKKVGSSYYLTLNKDISWSNGASMAAIHSTLGDYLYVIVTGDVTINRTTNGGAIYHNDLLYISGNGDEDSKLTAIGKGSADGAIYATGELDVYNANVDVTGSQYGIHAGGKLEIKNSTVAAKGSYSAVYGDGGLSLLGNMGVVLPVGGQIFGADIRNADGTRATEVLLAPVTAYDLKVCGKQVTSANAADIMGDGVFEFIAEQNVLVVRGDCEWHDAPIIESSIKDLGISVMAASTLKAVDASAIVLHKDTAIGGTGALTVSGVNAIYADGCELILFKAKVNANGTQYGIRGTATASLLITDSNARASLQKTEIHAKGGTAAIGGFASLALVDCYVKTPEGGEAKDGAIVDMNGAIVKEAEIVAGVDPFAKYDLWIDNTQVVSTNAADVLGNGVFSYDAASKTLTVSGTYHCSHVAEMFACIRSEIDGLTIKVAADSKLSGGGMVLFQLNGNTTVTGMGKLTTDCATDFSVNGGGKEVTLTFDNAQVVLSGAIRGNGAKEKLVIKNSDLDFSASSVSSILEFGGGIELIDCTIVQPAGASVKNGAIVTASGDVATGVVITADKPHELVNPFKDIKPEDYWYTPVLWAYYHTPQITTGTSADKFSPNNTCTRAQIVTFLWRAKGEPEPTLTVSPFVDVQDPSQYYYKAVLWAVENGITTGTDATHFSPGKGCTRAQVVTFQWRANGKPAPSTTVNPFTDVKADQYYYDAVLWAVGKGVTTGTTATTFSPDKTCTRGQIVTFLYRDMAT